MRSSSGPVREFVVREGRMTVSNSLGSFPALTKSEEKKNVSVNSEDKTKPQKRQQQQNFGNWKTGGWLITDSADPKKLNLSVNGRARRFTWWKPRRLRNGPDQFPLAWGGGSRLQTGRFAEWLFKKSQTPRFSLPPFMQPKECPFFTLPETGRGCSTKRSEMYSLHL